MADAFPVEQIIALGILTNKFRNPTYKKDPDHILLLLKLLDSPFSYYHNLDLIRC